MMKPGQVIFIGLAGACAVLVASGGLLMAGVGMEVGALTPQDRAMPGEKLESSELDSFRLPPYDEYAVVIERPLFNDDRLPQPDENVEIVDGPPGPEAPSVPLNITVNGIIITPELKVAMITDNATKERLRLREEMPLEGDQGAWVLQRIEPRKLVFEGGGDGPAEVELLTHTKALKGGRASPGKKPAGKKPGKQPAAQQGQETQPVQSAQAAMVQERRRQSGNDSVEDEQDRAAKAEEIRRRVAERRAQLREEAARRREEQDDNN